MKDIRAALVIFQSKLGDIQTNLIQMRRWIAMAEDQGASIICFPEMNITGYAIEPALMDYAIMIPGDASDFLIAEAKAHQMVILAGAAEKDAFGRVFASHLVIYPDETIQVYRKLHIAPPEEPFFTAGNSIPLFHFMGIPFGIQLCYDAHFPELSAFMAVKGAEVIFMPHASPRGTPEEKFRSWMRHLPARAYDNSCYILACNQAGGDGLKFPGISLAIDPSGWVIQKNVTGKESLMILDLKKDQLDAVRHHRMRFFLPKRRPELYDVDFRRM